MRHARFENVRVCPGLTGLREARRGVECLGADYKQGLQSVEMQSKLAVIEALDSEGPDKTKCAPHLLPR